jgi:hypothetical protein
MTVDPADAIREGKTRLTFRTEGERLNAYLAPLDSMDGALLVGSMLVAAVRSDADNQLFNDWRQALDLWLDRTTERIRLREAES